MAGLILICSLALGVIFLIMRKKPIYKAIPFALLVTYVAIVLMSTVFTRPSTYRQFNLTPFWSYRTILETHDWILFWEDILNVMMSLPVGFFVAILLGKRKHRIKLTALVGFLLSVSIELLQLFLMRGLFEFDDIFHNTLGAFLGCIICIILSGFNLKQK